MLRRLSSSIWQRGKVGRKAGAAQAIEHCRARNTSLRLCALARWQTLYVALANRDAVAAVNVAAGQFAVKGYFDTRLPGQSYFGAEPVALAVNADGSRLYVANWPSDAVAVIDTRKLTAEQSKQGMVEPDRFCADGVDADFDGVSSSASGGKLYVATAKGKGTGPNNFPQRDGERGAAKAPAAHTYIAHAAVRLAGDARCSRDREEPAAVDCSRARIESHEGGRRRRSPLPAARRIASST